MEDTLLTDAAERFAKGEMSREEKIYFEELRKNNPDLDQAVVEQLFFLNQLDAYADTKNFRGLLKDVEQTLVADKFMSRSTQQPGKLVALWTKYRRTVAVAASIAGIVSLLIATAVSSVHTDKNDDVTLLIGKVNEVERKTAINERKVQQLAVAIKPGINPLPVLESNFRATGFMIDASNNYLVTNAHVVKEAQHRLIVEDMNGKQFDASSVYVNKESDLAIIKITDTDFKPLPPLPYSFRKSGAELAEQFYMLGFPKQEIVYGEGYVSAKNGFRMDTLFCQLSTSANEGNSGSPVLSKNNEIIGIITSMQTNASGVVFAIKSANIFRAADEVKKMPQHENIKISTASSFKKGDREHQVARIQPYVFMIKGN